MEVKLHKLVFFILIVFLLKISVGDSWRKERKPASRVLNRKIASSFRS